MRQINVHHQQFALACDVTAGAAAAAVLALAVPAGASTGIAQISPEQVGYTATGAQFKYIDALVYLRNPGQYASQIASFGHSVQLATGARRMVSLTPSSSFTCFIFVYLRPSRATTGR